MTPNASWFADGEIDQHKFSKYLLDSRHRTGQHKLRLWESIFGIGHGEGQFLECLIRDQVVRGTVTERPPRGNLRRFGVLIEDFETSKHVGPVITAWVSEHGDWRESRPRFVTAYPVVR